MTIPGAKLETDQIKPFALAGNAILTLVSLATGTRFTFKIQFQPLTRAQRVSHFVAEACADLSPGRALDVAAGSGSRPRRRTSRRSTWSARSASMPRRKVRRMDIRAAGRRSWRWTRW